MEEQILVACIVVFPSFPGARRVKINDIYNQASAELTIVTEMFLLYRSMWSFFLASRPFYGSPFESAPTAAHPYSAVAFGSKTDGIASQYH